MEATMACMKVKLHCVDDVLVVTMRGLYTPAAHRDMRAAVQEALAIRPVRAIVGDMRGVVSTLSDQDRIDLVEEASTVRHPVREPIALVVPAPLLAKTRAMCAHAWSHGRYWVPFRCYEEALDWAQSRRPHPSRQSRPAPL